MATETCAEFFDCENSLSTEQGIRKAITKDSNNCAAHRVVDSNQVKRYKNSSIDGVQTFAAVTLGAAAADYAAYIAANPGLYLVFQSAYYDGTKHTIVATFSSI